MVNYHFSDWIKHCIWNILEKLSIVYFIYVAKNTIFIFELLIKYAIYAKVLYECVFVCVHACENQGKSLSSLFLNLKRTQICHQTQNNQLCFWISSWHISTHEMIVSKLGWVVLKYQCSLCSGTSVVYNSLQLYGL